MLPAWEVMLLMLPVALVWVAIGTGAIVETGCPGLHVEGDDATVALIAVPS